MIERNQADWDALCAELGRLGGDVLVYRRIVAEQAARIADLERQLSERDADQGEQA